MTVAERLKKIRGILKVNQKEMAAMLGINNRTYENYEKAVNPPGWDACQALVKLGYNANWLLTGDGEIKTGWKSYDSPDGFKTAGTAGEPGEGFVQVPRYEVAASAGGGALIHSEQIVDHLAFRSDWVRNALGVSVASLILINVIGDSMEPTLSEGDLILINRSVDGVGDNAVYVLRYDGKLVVKRLQRMFDGSVIIKSDNAMYGPETIKGDLVSSLDVVGRVVWCGRRM